MGKFQSALRIYGKWGGMPLWRLLTKPPSFKNPSKSNVISIDKAFLSVKLCSTLNALYFLLIKKVVKTVFSGTWSSVFTPQNKLQFSERKFPEPNSIADEIRKIFVAPKENERTVALRRCPSWRTVLHAFIPTPVSSCISLRFADITRSFEARRSTQRLVRTPLWLMLGQIHVWEIQN